MNRDHKGEQDALMYIGNLITLIGSLENSSAFCPSPTTFGPISACNDWIQFIFINLVWRH